LATEISAPTDSQYIFDYLNDVWDLLPDQDKVRFGETWKAYEQTYGSVWMQQFDSDLANTITRLPLYNILRWIKYDFDSTTEVNSAATYTSPQDLSGTNDLSARYLISLSVDGGSQIEIDLRGVAPAATTLSEIVARINLTVGAPIATASDDNQLLTLTSISTGAGSSLTFYNASAPAEDATEIVLGLVSTQLPLTTPTFPYQYQLTDLSSSPPVAATNVVGIPALQDTIHDNLVTVNLQQNVDYNVQFGKGIISFMAAPPSPLWAKDTLINYETPYNNFGYLMDLYDSNTSNYLKAVQGLWFAFWQGPRPEFIRRSLYLLFGLPTASKAGVVSATTPASITLTYTDMTTESFKVPTGLSIIVVPGQNVEQYQPLVSGINVFDKVNYPGFLRLEIGRPAVLPFLTQNATLGIGPDTDETKALLLLEANTYLPQIDVNAFISPVINVSNVTTFLRNIQPRSRTYLLQILVGAFTEQLPLMDEGLTTVPTDAWPNGQPSLGLGISFDATHNVDWNNNTMGNSATWTDAETNPYTGLILDDDYFCFGEYGQVDVYQSAVLIDSFAIEG
jgi:hypothetical protein